MPDLEFRCAFFARDYEASLAFYRDQLEWPVRTHWDRGADDRGTLFEAGGGIVEVLALPATPVPGWDAKPPVGLVLVVEVEDVRAAHDGLVARGVELSEGLTDQRWGHRSIRLSDPDGSSLYLFSRI